MTLSHDLKMISNFFIIHLSSLLFLQFFGFLRNYIHLPHLIHSYFQASNNFSRSAHSHEARVIFFYEQLIKYVILGKKSLIFGWKCRRRMLYRNPTNEILNKGKDTLNSINFPCNKAKLEAFCYWCPKYFCALTKISSRWWDEAMRVS